MPKSIIKKFFAFMLLLFALLGVACGTSAVPETNHEDDAITSAVSKSGQEDNTKYYFIPERIASDIGMNVIDGVIDFIRTEKEVKLIGTVHDGDIKVFSYDLHGNFVNEVTLQDNKPGQTWVHAAYADDEAIWLLRSGWDAERRGSTAGLFLDAFDHMGNYLEEIKLIGMDDFNAGNYGSIARLTKDIKGNIYIGFNSSSPADGFYAVFSENGEFVFDISNNKEHITTAMIKTANGRIAVLQCKLGGIDIDPLFRVINPDRMEYGDEILVDSYNERNRQSILFADGADGYDFLRIEGVNVFGGSFETGTSDLLAELRSKSTSMIPRFLYAGEAVFALEQGSSLSYVDIIRYEKTDTLPPDKKNLVVAALGESTYFQDLVFAFNQSNPEYHVEVKTYFTTWEEYDHAITQFNLDIISGKAFDIICLEPRMPISSYIRNGLFIDLYEYIDDDKDISREDYLPNILRILETDGRLYTVSSLFSIQTLVGKASDVGPNPGWTWDEFHSLLSGKPADAIPVTGEDPEAGSYAWDEYLRKILATSLFDFVDLEKGLCQFDTPAFQAVLKTAEKYLSSASSEVLASEFASGGRLLMALEIKSFAGEYNDLLRNHYFGAELSYKGFPDQDGIYGSAVSFIDRFGISALSEDKEGAFAFIKYMLMNNQYQSRDDIRIRSWGFPITKESLRVQAENSMNKDKSSGVSTQVDGETVWLQNPDQEDVRKIMELIEAATRESSDEYSMIIDIIIEEAGAYFSGAKTVEEITGVIQNRASLYLHERN